MHCFKCIKSSRPWEPEKWPDRNHVQTLAEAMDTQIQYMSTDRDGDDVREFALTLPSPI